MAIYDDDVHCDSGGFTPYERPVVGPRAFVARGPSGWAETFPRPAADRDLEAWLGSVSLDAALFAYASLRKAHRGSKDPWQYLVIATLLLDLTGRALTGEPGDVPAAAVVALWGLGEQAMKAAPKLGKVDSKDYPLEGTGRLTN